MRKTFDHVKKCRKFDKIHDLKNSPKNRNRGEPPQLDKKDFFFFF